MRRRGRGLVGNEKQEEVKEQEEKLPMFKRRKKTAKLFVGRRRVEEK